MQGPSGNSALNAAPAKNSSSRRVLMLIDFFCGGPDLAAMRQPRNAREMSQTLVPEPTKRKELGSAETVDLSLLLPPRINYTPRMLQTLALRPQIRTINTGAHDKPNRNQPKPLKQVKVAVCSSSIGSQQAPQLDANPAERSVQHDQGQDDMEALADDDGNDNDDEGRVAADPSAWDSDQENLGMSAALNENEAVELIAAPEDSEGAGSLKLAGESGLLFDRDSRGGAVAAAATGGRLSGAGPAQFTLAGSEEIDQVALSSSAESLDCLGYARTAKRVDVKALKDALWKGIQHNLPSKYNPNHNTTATSTATPPPISFQRAINTLLQL